MRDHCRVRWRFGRCELDLDRVELRRDGVPTRLEPPAFDVLAYLGRHRERVVSKDELLDEVWGTRFVSESALTSRIKSVRQAVGDNGRDQRPPEEQPRASCEAAEHVGLRESSQPSGPLHASGERCDRVRGHETSCPHDPSSGQGQDCSPGGVTTSSRTSQPAGRVRAKATASATAAGSHSPRSGGGL